MHAHYACTEKGCVTCTNVCMCGQCAVYADMWDVQFTCLFLLSRKSLHVCVCDMCIYMCVCVQEKTESCVPYGVGGRAHHMQCKM